SSHLPETFQNQRSISHTRTDRQMRNEQDRYLLSLLVLCIFTDPAAHAQDHLLKERLLKSDPEEVLDMDLGTTDLLRTATRDLSSRDIREAPANLQIISARQIKASGARDLFEVLQMVPGISWGST